jgi:isopentenyldiphosphate isomerase
MDEYIELLDSKGIPNGEKCMKSIAHKNGFFHASVHIWLYTKSGDILIQKRKHDKDTFPNLWDISVAGHISFGEEHLIAARRETEEEIGLKISSDDLQYIGTSEHRNIHSENLIDHELHHIYLCELKIPINRLVIQEEEVAEVKLMSIQYLEEKLLHTSSNFEFVPHGKNYYKRIFEAIKIKLA